MRYLRFLKRVITNAHYRRWWLQSLGILVMQGLRQLQDLGAQWTDQLRWQYHHLATRLQLPHATRIHSGLDPHYRILTNAPPDASPRALLRACGLNTLALPWSAGLSPQPHPLQTLRAWDLDPQVRDGLFFILSVELDTLAKVFSGAKEDAPPPAAVLQDLRALMQHPRCAQLAGRPILLCQTRSDDANFSATVRNLRQRVQDACGSNPWLIQASSTATAPASVFDAHLHPVDAASLSGEQALRTLIDLAALPRSHACLQLQDLSSAPTRTAPLAIGPALGVEIRNFMASALLTQSSHTPTERQCIFLDPTGPTPPKGQGPDLRPGLRALQGLMQSALCLAPPAHKPSTPRAAPPHPADTARPAVAVLLHLYYPDLIDEIAEHLARLNTPFDLLVSLGPHADTEVRERILQRWSHAEIHTFENRGRDIRPFIGQLPLLIARGYQCVLKLHTKKSPHREDGAAWRQTVFGSLIGHPDTAQTLCKVFSQYPTLGMVGPAQCVINHNRNQGLNRRWLTTLFRENHIARSWVEQTYPYFAAGSMFWFRPTALQSLLESPSVVLDRFEPEAGQVDSTLAHALERFMACLLYYRGYQVIDMPTALALAQTDAPAQQQAQQNWISHWSTPARQQRACLPFEPFS